MNPSPDRSSPGFWARFRRVRRTPARPLRRFSTLRIVSVVVLWGFFSGAGIAYNRYAYYAAQLPDLDRIDQQPDMATLVYSADGELIGEFYLQKRVLVPLERIPEHVRQAFISAEDRRFWDHPGFDIFGIARAAYSNFTSSGSQQGASTITQQLTRMILLSNERTVERKIKELILAVRVDRRLSKREILERYLNGVYLGHGAYGVQAAAEAYFGKDVDHLTVAEGAMLAGLVQRPSDYSPHHNMRAARHRQAYVLERMREDRYVSDSVARAALAEPVAIVSDEVPVNYVAAPYFLEQVRRWMQARFGTRSVFFGGMRIYTTLDMRMQRSAEVALRSGLESIDRMVGFRGPIGHLGARALADFRAQPPRPWLPGREAAALGTGAVLLPDVRYAGAVVGLGRGERLDVAVGDLELPMVQADARHLRKWRGAPAALGKSAGEERALAVGDLLPVRLVEGEKGEQLFALAQLPELEGALAALVPATGEVRALVGGYDFRRSQFNRATQGNRQIGSAIKPFIYATALAGGLSSVDIIRDSPVAIPTASGIWSPGNYDGEYHGNVTVRTALALSLNTVAVRLIVGTGVEAVIETMRAMGIRSFVPLHPSIALGTPDLTLMEVVAAYAAFANGGKLVEGQDDFPDTPPGRFIDLITAADGTILADYRGRVPRRQAISPGLAYLMVDLLKAPVERGTAKKAQALGRPAAGKTGTATMWKDAWFVGFTPDLLCGVWVGRDDSRPIGMKATGGTSALPIWLQFMQGAHPETPPRDFAVPDDVTLVRVDDRSGRPAAPGSPNAHWIPFLRGTVPSRFAPRVRSSRFANSGEFAPGAAEAKAEPE
ncbi:MAG TPA: PBP1A family penicillin-binding protein, partial [Kofleriaceae bacterium]|nr:PBP1A family penicillin-binding protein [Kofleriaceae bacterium]